MLILIINILKGEKEILTDFFCAMLGNLILSQISFSKTILPKETEISLLNYSNRIFKTYEFLCDSIIICSPNPTSQII